MKQLIVICLFLFPWMSMAYPHQKASVSARQIIVRMASGYASCRSYLDEGWVKTVIFEKDGNRTEIKPFSMAFIRPSDFRFEFKQRYPQGEWASFIIWMHGDSLKTYLPFKFVQPRTYQTLDCAVAGFIAISDLSAITVPILLMPDLLDAHRVTELTKLKLVAEEEIDGIAAFKIEGMNFQNNTITVWVDKQRFLLLKVYMREKFKNAFGDFDQARTITYRPQMNVEIPPEKLAFNPPGKSS